MNTFIERSQPPEAELPQTQPAQDPPQEGPQQLPANGVLDEQAPKPAHRDPKHVNAIAAAELSNTTLKSSMERTFSSNMG